MKLKYKESPVPPKPPGKVVLTLSEQEAVDLAVILGNTYGGNQFVQELFEAIDDLYLEVEPSVTTSVERVNGFYGYHILDKEDD